MVSSPGTNQGDTLKKGRKKKGEKKPIPEMKLTVNVQQWLRQENGKAMKVKIADFRIDKTKERGKIRSINYDDVARKVTGYQALPLQVCSARQQTRVRRSQIACATDRL